MRQSYILFSARSPIFATVRLEEGNRWLERVHVGEFAVQKKEVGGGDVRREKYLIASFHWSIRMCMAPPDPLAHLSPRLTDQGLRSSDKTQGGSGE